MQTRKLVHAVNLARLLDEFVGRYVLAIRLWEVMVGLGGLGTEYQGCGEIESSAGRKVGSLVNLIPQLGS